MTNLANFDRKSTEKSLSSSASLATSLPAPGQLHDSISRTNGTGLAREAEVTAHEFLTELIAIAPAGSSPIVCGFASAPDDKTLSEKQQKARWKGRRLEGVLNEYSRDSNRNTYVTISAFSGDRRTKTTFKAMLAVMLDDIGQKIEGGKVKLEPSIWLETSRGNYQGWYLLDEPCCDRKLAEGVLEALVASGLTKDGKDPGMRGVTRYGRIPGGINNKQTYGEAWRVVAHRNGVLRRYSIDELIQGFGIKVGAPTGGYAPVGLFADPLVQFLDAKGMVKSADGEKAHITCPNVSAHTDQIDNGSAIGFFEGDGKLGFKCWHGHCEHVTLKDVWAKAKDAGYDQWARENGIHPHTNGKAKASQGQAAVDAIAGAREKEKAGDLSYEAFKDAIAEALEIKDIPRRKFELAAISQRFRQPNSSVNRVIAEQTKIKVDRLTSYSLKDIANLKFEGFSWKIPRFMPSIGLTILFAFAKDGKSKLTYRLISSLIKASPFLEEKPNGKFKVLLIQCEEPITTIQDNLRGQGMLADEVIVEDRLHIETDWDIEDLEQLDQWVDAHKPDVLVFDSLRAISKNSGVSENSQEFANPVYALQAYLNQKGLAGWMLHHANKSKDAQGLAKMAGTSAIAGACDNIFTLARVSTDQDDPKRVLGLGGRNCNGKFNIHFEEGEWPDYDWVLDSEQGVDLADKQIKDRIVSVLVRNSKARPEGLTASDLRELLEMQKADKAIFRPLKHLVQNGIIGTTGKKPAKYFLPKDFDFSQHKAAENYSQQPLLDVDQDVVERITTCFEAGDKKTAIANYVPNPEQVAKVLPTEIIDWMDTGN